MDQGTIVADGRPEEVFGLIETLASAQVRMPQVAELACSLERRGTLSLSPYPVTLERYMTLLSALRRAGFDALDDQPDVPYFGVDLWLVERASGSFYHDVVLQPESAAGLHGEIAGAIRTQLREALRPVVA